MIRKCVFVLLSSLLLTACAASEPTPPYLVRIGGAYDWRCGGYVIDEHHIITAAHCGQMTRARTQDGATVEVRMMTHWPEIDTALYLTDEYLGLAAYATMSSIETDKPAYAFGYCPLWQSSTARFAEYTTTETSPLYCHELHIAGSWICNGDSGGIIEQNGNVVAMIAQFRGNPLAAQNGRTFAYATCAVPGELIAQRVEEWRQER